MKKLYFIGTTLAALMLLVSACSPQATPAAAPPATMPAATLPAATMAPANTAVPAAMPASAASVMVAKNAALGSFLVDSKNMTLYLFTKDTPNTSNCYDKCAVAWPPLLTTGAPVGTDGVDASKLGTTKRKDGSMQVTYNGWPLYYFVKDTKAGDTVGQDVGQVWYVIAPDGSQVSSASMPVAAAATATVPASLPVGTAAVMLAKSASLGSFLVDSKNMSLYLFTKDTPNTSNCYDKCAVAWPPLLTTGDPVAVAGLDASKLGTTKRTDGSLQVTFNGWPLYYFVKDAKAGDTTGQAVGGVWYLISPTGDQIAAK